MGCFFSFRNEMLLPKFPVHLGFLPPAGTGVHSRAIGLEDLVRSVLEPWGDGSVCAQGLCWHSRGTRQSHGIIGLGCSCGAGGSDLP